MCGIAGIIGPEPARPDDLDLKLLTAQLSHRGPDGEGIAALGRVGLGATRLAIRDPSPAGAQPYGDDAHRLVFNGELYNAEALHARLSDGDRPADARSDTAVLFHHLRTFGVEATLPLLHGMFAFAFTDGTTTWLARDPWGIKPLVWAQHRDRVCFASEAQALKAVLPLEPDPLAAVFALTGRREGRADHTVFRSVRQVRPGHVLRVSGDRRITTARWHHPAALVDPALYRELDALDPEAVAHRLDELVDAAVDRMVVGDRGIGAFVSGGVDSALIAAMARRSVDLHLFSADVAWDRSEAPAANRLATVLALPLEFARFQPDDLIEDWAETTRAYEAPIVTHPNALPFSGVARLARVHDRPVALTGEGADELFLGYPESAFRTHRRLLRLPLDGIRRLYGLVPGLDTRVLPELVEAQEKYVSYLTEDFETRRDEAESHAAFAFLGDRQAGRHALTLDLLGSHLRTLLHRNDRMGMRWGVECRFPYLDEDVIRFGVNLPVRHKLALTRRFHDRKHPFLRDKAVLRDVARARLPADVAERVKDGFPSLGHRELRVDPSFLRGGWLSDALGLTDAGVTHLCEHESPYHAAKLASVEVFGRLFGHDESTEQVTEDLRAAAVVRV